MSDTPDLPDDDATGELLRVWLTGEGMLQCSISLSETDPEFWSQILADLTQYIAGAIAEEKGTDPEAMLEEVHNGVTKFLSEEEGEA
jgi:Domain of unknown function (DUF5076)